jgi:hypothetical protein
LLHGAVGLRLGNLLDHFLSILSQLLREARVIAVKHLLSYLSILSQLLRDWNTALNMVVFKSFNSFPVAAEVLAAYSLISLSSANFEVHESSPALPPDACMDSCKPFPDSRRKEGRWRERSGVEQKR